MLTNVKFKNRLDIFSRISEEFFQVLGKNYVFPWYFKVKRFSLSVLWFPGSLTEAYESCHKKIFEMKSQRKNRVTFLKFHENKLKQKMYVYFFQRSYKNSDKHLCYLLTVIL